MKNLRGFTTTECFSRLSFAFKMVFLDMATRWYFINCLYRPYMYFWITTAFDDFLQIDCKYCIILSFFRVYLVTILKALQYPSRLPHDSKLIFILSFSSSCSSLCFRCASLTGSLYRLYLFCHDCLSFSFVTEMF